MEKAKEDYDLLAPCLPRKRRNPSDRNSTSGHEYQTVKDSMRREFFEIVDVAIGDIKSRFQQEDFKTLLKLEAALLTPPSVWDGIPGVEEVLLEDGFDVPKLKANLESLPDIAPGKTSIRGIADDFAALQPETKKLFRHLEELLILLLVVPVSAASAERSFSAMRRLKNYLRTSTGQARFNHLAILHMYKERLDNLDMKRVMKIFVSNETRHRIFGEIN